MKIITHDVAIDAQSRRYVPTRYELMETETIDPADLILDHIDAAGQFKIFDARNALQGLRFAEHGVDLVTRIDAFIRDVEPPKSKAFDRQKVASAHSRVGRHKAAAV